MLLVACGGPKKVALDYENASIRGDIDSAYALASKEDKAARSLEEARSDASLFGAALRLLVKNSSVSVDSVAQNGDRATVVLAVSSKTLGGDENTTRTSISLRREPEGWRVVTGWAAFKAMDEARKGVTAEDWRGAKAILDAIDVADLGADANKLKFVADMRAEVNEQVSKLIAGKWSKLSSTDAMTDNVAVSALLHAENEIQPMFVSERPMLFARCRAKQLEVYISTAAPMSRNYYNGWAQIRYRIGPEKASTAYFSTAADGTAVFLSPVPAWLDRIANSDSTTLTVELPFYQRSEVVVFKLEGARQAIDLVRSACGVASRSATSGSNDGGVSASVDVSLKRPARE